MPDARAMTDGVEPMTDEEISLMKIFGINTAQEALILERFQARIRQERERADRAEGEKAAEIGLRMDQDNAISLLESQVAEYGERLYMTDELAKGTREELDALKARADALAEAVERYLDKVGAVDGYKLREPMKDRLNAYRDVA